jgi:hypothetical protein
LSFAWFSSFTFSLGLFFHNVKIKTFTGWKGNFRLLVTNDENVILSGGKGFSIGVLQVDNIEATQMSFDVEDGSDSTDVVSTGDIGQMSWFVRNPADNLVLFQIILDGISFVDIWMWESDGSGIVSNNVWDFVWTNGFGDNFAELEVGFSTLDTNQGESTLFVIQKSIVLSSLDDAENVHNSNWEFSVSSNLVIDFESCLFILGNDGDLFSVSCQSQSISEIMIKNT